MKLDEKTVNSINELFRYLADAWEETSDHVKDVFDSLLGVFIDRKQIKNHNYNWRVPIDTRVKSQVKLQKINLPNIRNQL